MQPNSIASYAWKYHELGFNVLPLFGYTKNPSSAHFLMPEGWKKYQTQRVTEAEIKLWFEDNKPTGIGCITGKSSGVVVIDVDSYKKGGMQFHLESPWRVKSARGGVHEYFQYVEPIKSSGFREGVNIEIKADGGFVVLPPTEVTIDGIKGKYEWLPTIDGKTRKREDMPAIKEDDLAPYRVSTSKDIKLMELLEAEYGNQHNNLRTLCLMIFNRFREDEWETAAQFVRHQASNFKPPADPRKVEETIRDTMKYIKDNPKEGSSEKKVMEEIKTVHFYTGVEADKAYDEMMAKVGEGISTGYPALDSKFTFQPTHVYLVSASTFTGKTLLTINMAYRIAETGINVAYFSLEMGLWVVQKIRHFTSGLAVPDGLTIIESDNYLSAETITKAIEDLGKVDLIFIDHTHYLKLEKSNKVESIDKLITDVKYIAVNRFLPVVVIAHIRKLNERRAPQLDDLRDSSYLQQVPSVILMMYRERNSDDDINQGAPEMKPNGYVYIRKNRITGNLKAEEFIVSENEKILMNGDDGFQALMGQIQIDNL